MAMLGAVIVGVSIAQLFLGSAIAIAVLFALALAVTVWIAPWTGIMILGIAGSPHRAVPAAGRGR